MSPWAGCHPSEGGLSKPPQVDNLWWSGLKPAPPRRVFDGAPHRPRFVLYLAGSGRADLGSDQLPGNNQFHPPIALATGRVIIRRYRLRLAKSSRDNRSRGNPLLHQIIANRARTLFGQLLIVFIGADAIGMPFHLELQSRVS